MDAFVTTHVLAALAPAALQVSLRATEQVLAERAELENLWSQRLERAAINADRARRCYRLAEPENRLVVRQLEKDWEQALAPSRCCRRSTTASPCRQAPLRERSPCHPHRLRRDLARPARLHRHRHPPHTTT
ncbi:hypothetical protein ABZZ74_44120, partial [Streptomyces sp. NPDC006476]